MGLASASFLGQDDISPPLWAAAPRRHPHYSEVEVDLEATHSAEDSHLRMACFKAAPHDPGRVLVHASGLSSEVPSMWWGPRGLFPPLLSMFVGSRGMVRGRGGPSLCDIRGGILELLVGGVSSRGRRIFATLWAIWIHRNEVIFKGVTPSGDAIIHTAEGFYLSWHRGGVCLLNHVPLL